MRVPGIPYVQGRNAYDDADGKKYGVAIHNTANNATAEGEASYAARRTDSVSSHFYCDNNSVIQSLDTNSRAGHAASKPGNENAIAVEITGTNDKTRAWWLANVDWAELGRVLAVCCRTYGISVRRASVAEMKANPKVKAFYSHNDMRLAWGGTTHTDPGENFPWDKLFSSVNAALNPTPPEDDLDATQAAQLKAVYESVVGTTKYSDGSTRTLETSAAEAASGVMHGKTIGGGSIYLSQQLDKVNAGITALIKGTVDDADKAEILAAVAAVGQAVDQVDDNVLNQLGAGDLTAQEKADLLRAVLGDDAAAVGLLLQV